MWVIQDYSPISGSINIFIYSYSLLPCVMFNSMGQMTVPQDAHISDKNIISGMSVCVSGGLLKAGGPT